MSTPARERGSTSVADRAVRRIAERAATEALAPGEVRTTRSSASVRGRRARVAVTVTLPYPEVLDDAGERVRSHVADRTQRLTGLVVPSARVRIAGLRPRARTDEGEVPGPEQTGDGRVWRPWSQRRVPVGVLALAVAAVCGVLLYDVLAVHAAGRSPGRWRTGPVEWLTTHGPAGSAWPGLAAALAVLGLGVWLLVLAVTPGLRGRFPLREPLPDLHAALDRSAAAALLRDAVTELPGITRVRVGVGRRRVRVRAGLAFGQLEAERDALAGTVARTVAGWGAARAPRVRVRLRPEPAWRAPAVPEPVAPEPVARESVPGGDGGGGGNGSGSGSGACNGDGNGGSAAQGSAGR
ncbi:DUF6286 domain-containing Asp23/Gls24 family envelope stress response protein [Streptomyces sp. NPDC058308]|uniref:DUF6286 domain-containing Asp23/Gls24 family envelope stress response protein n=1 Tax=Streptomyces sp. NPDC058308 TaxID=3346440 RepID=UPI0036E5DE52